MRRAMAVLLVGMCAGCARQVKAPLVATAPAAGQAPVTTTVDLTRVPEPAAPKPMPTADEATAGEHPLKVSAAVAASMLESRPVMLAYPAEAKARHLTGKVLFHAIIAQDGSVKGTDCNRVCRPSICSRRGRCGAELALSPIPAKWPACSDGYDHHGHLHAGELELRS
jgi:hypothetical protein